MLAGWVLMVHLTRSSNLFSAEFFWRLMLWHHFLLVREITFSFVEIHCWPHRFVIKFQLEVGLVHVHSHAFFRKSLLPANLLLDPIIIGGFKV